MTASAPPAPALRDTPTRDTPLRREAPARHIDTLVIGGSQAGLR